MDALRQDLIYAFRVLRKDRAYAAAVILTLAICLGANTAIFTVVRSVLLRPLPYPESDRLVSSFDGFPGAGVERAGTSVPNYVDRRAMTDVFSGAALYQWSGYRVGEGTQAEGVSAMNVTPSFFQVLGAQPSRGRLFAEADGTPGKNKVAVLSYTFAARQPAGINGIVGSRLRLNGEVYDVVGVLPESFSFLSPEVRVFVPLAFKPEELGEGARHSQNHELLLRLAPGVTLARAQARVDAQNALDIERAGPIKAVAPQCRLPHDAPAPRGRHRSQRARGAPDALGRRRLRCAHRGREHRQPLPRPRQRPHEGACHPQCHRRGEPPPREAAHCRSHAPHDPGRIARGRPRVGRSRCDRVDRLYGPPEGTRDPSRRRGARHDARARSAARDRRRCRAGAAAGAREPEQRAQRRRTFGHVRPDREVRAALAGRRTGRVGVRAADGRGAPAREFPASARRQPGLRPRTRPHRPREPAHDALPRRCGAPVVCEPGAGAGAGAAGRRVGGAQQLSAVQLGRQQQRHHPRRPGLEGYRIGRLAQPAVCVAWLSRGSQGAAQEWPLLHGQRYVRRTQGSHRRRTAGEALLAQSGSGGPTHVLARLTGGRREARPEGDLAARRRRRRNGEAQRARGRRECARGCLLSSCTRRTRRAASGGRFAAGGTRWRSQRRCSRRSRRSTRSFA